MQCGNVILMGTIIEGKEEDIGKGVLMGFVGSKFSRSCTEGLVHHQSEFIHSKRRFRGMSNSFWMEGSGEAEDYQGCRWSYHSVTG